MMMLKRLIILCSLFASYPLVDSLSAKESEKLLASSQLSEGKPEAVGISPRGLTQAAKIIADAVDKGDLKGAVVLVARDNTVVLHEALGWKDEKNSVPMTKDTLFRMASNTKAITAAAILHLVASEKLQVTDRVSKYLPAFDNPKCKEITIHQLLTHTGGLRINTLFIYPLLSDTNLKDEVNRFAVVGPAVDPGEGFSYSNPGYNILAAIIEVVSGKSYSEYCQSAFYDPLGLLDTCHQETNADKSRMSDLLVRNKNGTWATRWRPGGRPTVPFARGSGGLVSSARDYAVFCSMMLNKGAYADQLILPPNLVSQAITNQTAGVPKAKKYGYGWFIPEKGVFAHSGADGTQVYCDSSLNLIVLILTQSQNAKTPNWRFFEAVRNSCAVNGKK